eukprot:2471611-Amphidinium_carterae.1
MALTMSKCRKEQGAKALQRSKQYRHLYNTASNKLRNNKRQKYTHLKGENNLKGKKRGQNVHSSSDLGV